MPQKSEDKTSIFGSNIDRRCPNSGFFGKLFVVLGILADAEQSEYYTALDVELRKQEGRY